MLAKVTSVGENDNHVVLLGGGGVTVGLAPRQADLMKGTASFVEGRVKDDSIWAVLHRECHVLFPDEAFADLFQSTGRRSVPPRIVAVVMVLQRLFGLSDREAVETFEFDARWKYACGGLDFDHPGFVHTVLFDMRARLDRSQRPRRIFEVSLSPGARRARRRCAYFPLRSETPVSRARPADPCALSPVPLGPLSVARVNYG